MLKTNETYQVTVVLNDGQAMDCTLLSKPDAITLAAVAETQGVSAELKEAAAFTRDLVIPAPGEDTSAKTPITVAGTEIGEVHIRTTSAYVWQARKPRKPKPVETGETSEPAGKQKRKRKPETSKTPETSEPVTE